MQVLTSELSLGAKNHYVHMFKQLVYYSLGIETLIKTLLENKIQDRLLPERHIAEFDRDLYNKAISLPEAQTVSLKKLSSDSINPSKYQYGKFIGGTTYSTLDGEINTSSKRADPQVGWIILDLSSTEYCLFRNENVSYIIAIKDFVPEPIVEDFMPLFEKLNEHIRRPGLYLDVLDDLLDIGSLSVSFRADLAPKITANLDLDLSVNLQPYYDLGLSARASLPLTKRGNEPKTEIVPRYNTNYNKNRWRLFWWNTIGYKLWLNRDSNLTQLSDSPWAGIEAIIYAIPMGNDGGYDINSGMTKSVLLKCFQTPESLSYTAQAIFESQSPRGTQQPFQFYQGASAMNISFTLEWHISEIYKNPDPSQRTLQGIAEVAESFTRPWDNSNGSIKPKLCKVILPSISEMGYITQAQIEYSGNMIGSNEGVITQNNYNTEDYTMTTVGTVAKPTEYGYDTIKVTFDLLIVKDIKLSKSDEKSAIIASQTLSLQSTDIGEILFGDARLSEDSTEIEFIYKNSVVESVENPHASDIKSSSSNQQKDIQNTITQPA